MSKAHVNLWQPGPGGKKTTVANSCQAVPNTKLTKRFEAFNQPGPETDFYWILPSTVMAGSLASFAVWDPSLDPVCPFLWIEDKIKIKFNEPLNLIHTKFLFSYLST